MYKYAGVPLEKVYVSETSTDKCANTHPTAASVGADLNGFAVQDACRQITARLEKYRHKDPNMEFKDMALAAWLDRVDLSAHGYYKTPGLLPYLLLLLLFYCCFLYCCCTCPLTASKRRQISAGIG
jgi:xanthine dehydrogenase/oxidase